jgi:hypothetical protein
MESGIDFFSTISKVTIHSSPSLVVPNIVDGSRLVRLASSFLAWLAIKATPLPPELQTKKG